MTTYYPKIYWNNDGGILRSSDEVSKQFLENINTNFLTQAVIEPTLGEGTLDLIFVNDPLSIFDVQIHEPIGFSDKMHLHSSLYWELYQGI